MKLKYTDQIKHKINIDYFEINDIYIPAKGKKPEQTTIVTADIPVRFLNKKNTVKIVMIGGHMHKQGYQVKLERYRDGKWTCISNIKNWDFNWQRTYYPKKPIELRVDDLIRLTCKYKNKTDKSIYVLHFEQ